MLILNHPMTAAPKRKKPSFLVVGLITAVMLVSMISPASAQRLAFLRNSILTDFSKSEIESFLKTARETLERSPDTKIIEWQSPDGSKRGKILPKITYQNGEQTCRRTAFQVIGSEPKVKEQYRFELCKHGDQWHINPGPKFLTKTAESELHNFIQSLLNNPKPGHPFNWHSESSGHTAVIVIVDSGEKPSVSCQVLAVSLVDDQGKHLAGQFQFCKDKDNQWQYTPSTDE